MGFIPPRTSKPLNGGDKPRPTHRPPRPRMPMFSPRHGCRTRTANPPGNDRIAHTEKTLTTPTDADRRHAHASPGCNARSLNNWPARPRPESGAPRTASARRQPIAADRARPIALRSPAPLDPYPREPAFNRGHACREVRIAGGEFESPDAHDRAARPRPIQTPVPAASARSPAAGPAGRSRRQASAAVMRDERQKERPTRLSRPPVIRYPQSYRPVGRGSSPTTSVADGGWWG